MTMTHSAMTTSTISGAPAPLLSVVMPVFNEASFVPTILTRVIDVPVAKEVIVVDDGSTDDSPGRVRQLISDRARDFGRQTVDVRLIESPRNRGKGSAVKQGFTAARGDVVLVQDADLEYDPSAFPELLEPIRKGDADVVYGSRFGHGPVAAPYYGHRTVNRAVTGLANLGTGLRLTDVATCYKVMRGDLARGLAAVLQEQRFGFDAEVTCLLAGVGARFEEVAVTYQPRSVAEGKKIRWRDGMNIVHVLLRHALSRRSAPNRFTSSRAIGSP